MLRDTGGGRPRHLYGSTTVLDGRGFLQGRLQLQFALGALLLPRSNQPLRRGGRESSAVVPRTAQRISGRNAEGARGDGRKEKMQQSTRQGTRQDTHPGVKVVQPFGSILYLIHTIRSKDTHDLKIQKRGSTKID